MRLCQCIFAFLASFFAFGRDAMTRQAPQERRSQIISCASEDGGKHYCEADTRNGARLVRQRSETPCKEGESWGYDEEGIWVDKGCGGEFALGRSENSGSAGSESAARTITCASQGGLRKVCLADTSNGVKLVRQRSDAKCKEGSSWGHDAGGIWHLIFWDRTSCSRKLWLCQFERSGMGYVPSQNQFTPLLLCC